ncbi:MAG: ABC transporter permease [Chloroflexi bacterium]|nr:ABC transporter permease [Chloroflexota bacterium]MDA1002776.1 ABC transporter permease [Chloroflexota bacterium]
MQRYILQRLLLMIPTLVGVTMVVFLMVRLIPGDIVSLMAGDFGAVSPEQKQRILEEFGLHENIAVQYVRWFGRLVQLDMGTSLLSGRTVTSELAARLPVTLELGVLALLTSIVIGIPIGIISAIRQNSFADYAGRSLAIGILAAPNFWIALILIVMAARYFTWGVPPRTYVHLTEDPIGNLKMMFVPAMILGGASSGALMRYTRTTMLEVLRQDYVRTAWSKGLNERAVVTRHALRNALIPVVTVIGLGLPSLLGGTVIIESIYGIPGMGRYYIAAINQLDFPVIQGINILIAFMVVFSNLGVDLIYAVLDPRISYG